MWRENGVESKMPRSRGRTKERERKINANDDASSRAERRRRERKRSVGDANEGSWLLLLRGFGCCVKSQAEAKAGCPEAA